MKFMKIKTMTMLVFVFSNFCSAQYFSNTPQIAKKEIALENKTNFTMYVRAKKRNNMQDIEGTVIFSNAINPNGIVTIGIEENKLLSVRVWEGSNMQGKSYVELIDAKTCKNLEKIFLFENHMEKITEAPTYAEALAEEKARRMEERKQEQARREEEQKREAEKRIAQAEKEKQERLQRMSPEKQEEYENDKKRYIRNFAGSVEYNMEEEKIAITPEALKKMIIQTFSNIGSRGFFSTAEDAMIPVLDQLETKPEYKKVVEEIKKTMK